MVQGVGCRAAGALCRLKAVGLQVQGAECTHPPSPPHGGHVGDDPLKTRLSPAMIGSSRILGRPVESVCHGLGCRLQGQTTPSE